MVWPASALAVAGDPLAPQLPVTTRAAPAALTTRRYAKRADCSQGAPGAGHARGEGRTRLYCGSAMSTNPASASHPCEFGICDGSGFVIDEPAATARDCRCRSLRIAATRARALEARIPKRYRAISFEHSDVIDIERRCPTQVREIRAFVANISGNLDAGHGLWLTGSFGTGKTALAMIVSKAAIDAGRTVAIYSCPRLLSVIRESIDPPSRGAGGPSRGNGGGVLDFLDRLAAADLLHIDDLGAEHRTDWVLEQLYTIINARYEDERSTLVTSNLGRDELAAQLGERIVSRLEGMCEILPFFGGDARRVAYEVAGEGPGSP
jgi:DNA replication protein DnaC